MSQIRRTAQRGEIVQSGRDVVSGPNTRWMPADPVQFPIEQVIGGGQLGAYVDPALMPTGGGESYETPVSSAKGQVIRLLPFSLAWLVLAVGVVWVLGLSWPYFLLMFSALTAASYWRMNLDGHEHSRNGVERFRIRSATQIRLDEIAKDHELRRMALEGYLRHLEGGNEQ